MVIIQLENVCNVLQIRAEVFKLCHGKKCSLAFSKLVRYNFHIKRNVLAFVLVLVLVSSNEIGPLLKRSKNIEIR